MSRRALRYAMVLLAFLAVPLVSLAAQSGSIAGTVKSSEGFPIFNARVDVKGSGGLEAGGASTRADGTYRISPLAEGTYTVTVRAIGYAQFTATSVAVASGPAARLDVTVQQDAAVTLAPLVVTASRQQETVLQTPASVQVVPTIEITERPAVTVTDHMKGLPGVDISQGGLLQSNVVARGFNNIFSGSMLMLIDGRYAAVPSLRVNVPAFFPTTNEDIERVEVLLGPGSALYGPNSANGVLNVITKSPFSSQGTTLSLAAGERDMIQTAFRHAGAPSPKFGYKISADWMRGYDWKFIDAAEPVSPGRDYGVRRYGGQARVDLRPNANTEATANIGYSNASRLIELTGLGAGQAKDWSYTSFHGTLRHKRFFTQGYLNISDAGETFLLRTNQRIIDKSRLWSLQAQHGFDVGGSESVTYGVDYIVTDARTEGSINGRNEADDGIKEIGGYLHSVTKLTPQWELLGALRVDKNSRLSSAVWSPRTALTYRPTPDHALRLTYNRAFEQPTSNNRFLDILGGTLPPAGFPIPPIYDIRAIGVPKDGFHFRGYCGLGGVDDLCMRVPAAFSAGLPPGTGALPLNAATLWRVAVGFLCTNPAPQIAPACPSLAAIPNPTSAQVGTQLRTLNPTTQVFGDVAPGDVRDVDPLRPTITNTLEAGYKGIINQRTALTVDVWYTKKQDFVGPLIVETPNVFLDRASTIAYLTPFFGAGSAAAIGTAMAGLPGGTLQAGTLGVPLATVVANDPLTQSSDMVLTYRNFGDVDLFGADFTADVALDTRFSVTGTLSLVNKDFFSLEEVGGVAPIALNASKSKGSLTGRFRDGGWSAEARMRSIKGFPVNSGVYVGDVDGHTIFDAQLAYRFPNAKVIWSLNVQDVFDKSYRTFVGVPTLGRLALTKISWTL